MSGTFQDSEDEEMELHDNGDDDEEDEDEIELDDDEFEDDEHESLLEPQVILQNESSLCSVCQGPLGSHYLNQPCSANTSSHFLLEDSSTSTTLSMTSNRPKCVICTAKNPSREHLANHFMQELVEELEGETLCGKCPFNAPDGKALILHEVSRHDGWRLDRILQDAAVVSSKRAEVEARGHRQSLGPLCPICDQQMHKSHGRDHVSWHFVEELRLLITDPSKCPECSYVGEKLESVTRHLALFHCKLDEFLQDDQLVAVKRMKALAKPKKVTIGPKCPICDIKDPAREHVSRHFMAELMDSVLGLEDQLQCPECPYRGEKSQNVARHIALVHSKLDLLLADEELVRKRRQEYQAKPNKINIGSECPVCDQPLTKQHSRVHVIWHFIEELRTIVQDFEDPTRCDFCTYMNPSSDKVVKHIALGHSKLDEMLQDEELLRRKRTLISSKPKKESIGPLCPICGARDPTREHVARHYGDELNELVSKRKDQFSCSDCPFKGEKPKNLGLHIALVHGQLDVFLKNKALLKQKKELYQSQPKKLNIGPRCPICDLGFTKSQNRDHVAWHFIDELRDFVQTFEDPQKCWKCDYRSEKMDNLVKHVALGHSQLDELLQDSKLVKEKRAKALAKPKRVSIGPFCPICDTKDPQREHVARHFSEELLAIVNQYPDPCACMHCEYKGDKPKTLSIHVALVHAKLDLMLMDPELVQSKRESFHSKPKKLTIGPVCPVCDLKFTKTQNRDHVSWHYIDELRAIVQEFEDPSQCPKCPYSGDTNEKMVKHVALGHSMLDALLQDESLLEMKRMKALSKPKKVVLGPSCPICESKDPSREHVSRHFSEELNDIVNGFEDPLQCTQCSYKSDRVKNVAIHIALVHSILDHFMTDTDLVKSKREHFFGKPQKVSVGSLCPICDAEFPKGHNRDHLCQHFMEDLRDYVLGFTDASQCNECPFSSEKLDNLVKHVALGHSKLDEFLSNEQLVADKRERFLTKPKKIQIGPQCPICDIKFNKSQNRDHVSWHFIEELRLFVQSLGSDKKCQQCYYTTDKLDNLVKHYALGHSKLDELLQDEELIQRKREEHAKKPKRLSFGPDCPICNEPGKEREHVARHFMAELLELVNEMPNKKRCNQCTYKSNKREYMAKHLGLFHCKLDELMANENLVKHKQKEAAARPKKLSMGESCIICGFGCPTREHVARHFQPELLEITSKFDSPLSCAFCQFTADKKENVAKHVALVHGKLDEMICNDELVKSKASEYKNGSNLSAGPSIKIEPVRKSQRQAAAKSFIKGEPLSKKRFSSEEEEPGEEQQPKKMRVSSFLSTSIKQVAAPKVTIEKAGTQEAKSVAAPSVPSVSLLKASLLKEKTVVPAARTASVSLLKQPLKSKPKSVRNPLKPLPTVQITRTEPKRSPLPALPPSISLTPTAPKNKESIVLPTQPVLDTASIADINNSWAESLMNSSAAKSRPMKPVSPSKLFDQKEAIGSLTLTPATGNPRIHPASSSGPTITLQRVTSSLVKASTLIAPSVTLTPANPSSKKPKLNFTPTATITPIGRKVDSKMQMFPSKPLEKTQLIGPFAKLGKPLINPEQLVITPEIMESSSEDESSENTNQQSIEDENMIVLEPQIFFDDDDSSEGMDGVQDGSTTSKHEADTEEFSEFCDLCGMELEHHPDNQPCPPEEGFKSDFQSCPVCSKPEPTKEHVARHFLEELKVAVEAFDDPLSCNKCDYQSEKTSETVALHIALNHDSLKSVLPSANRQSSNRKAHIGNLCPICDFVEPTREHVSRHFMNELLDHVATLQDHLRCSDCTYQGEKPQNLAKHIALVHNMLDGFLSDHDLVQAKRTEAMLRPKKISIGSTCPVCLQSIQKRDSRVHVIWHFMPELRAMVQEFEETSACNFCPYTNPNPDKMAKHMALGHSKLDELLSDGDLVAAKQKIALAKPKKLVIGPECPICGVQFTKSQNRDHVASHFMEDLRSIIVNEFEDPQACNQCEYSTDKMDNLVKHLALGHSKLDEFLLDENLVAMKKKNFQASQK